MADNAKKLYTIFLTMILCLGVFSLSHSYAAERSERDFIGASYQGKVVNCNEWITLRYAPSVESASLAQIPLGTIVTVYDGPVYGINGFYPVYYKGMKGYCLKDYLQYYSGGGAPKR